MAATDSFQRLAEAQKVLDATIAEMRNEYEVLKLRKAELEKVFDSYYGTKPKKRGRPAGTKTKQAAATTEEK